MKTSTFYFLVSIASIATKSVNGWGCIGGCNVQNDDDFNDDDDIDANITRISIAFESQSFQGGSDGAGGIVTFEGLLKGGDNNSTLIGQSFGHCVTASNGHNQECSQTLSLDDDEEIGVGDIFISFSHSITQGDEVFEGAVTGGTIDFRSAVGW
eukprot:CAMPEP_0194354556 /NCGR_PEP_ID=MMETSP0174-20130528/2691_1 /TAXON_ID=216777 /ORGANISM="Proboscia alata, Strain PI-D3" /LENGTH=153 /DNA_ID=CAMNT_0039123549 /DNA_START=71 /DNA_END=529 /DNA_ORIENTATION=+